MVFCFLGIMRYDIFLGAHTRPKHEIQYTKNSRKTHARLVNGRDEDFHTEVTRLPENPFPRVMYGS